MNDFYVVIPSRLDSKRLARKALALIDGKPLIQWVYHRAIASKAKSVIIATDSEEIASVARSFGAIVELTNEDHKSGTDRIFEVCDRLNWDDDQVVVNLQGDNPLMPSENINQIAQMMNDCDIATLSAPIQDHEIIDPNVVKVSTDPSSNDALFFKRNINSDDYKKNLERHIGIYAYNVASLKRFSLSPQSEDEKREKLEQLRAYSLDMRIKVEQAQLIPGPDVDTQDDLKLVQSILQND
ncbi:3-deoxy-manno-octulosonate cytidylyltransferase [Gammaproteobacteria bacterium]|nr:3-deoxy-manno-octulosonate cytidylyltransferase [Gammaproteobacteria bacterium]MDC0225612.1 3-deoxy-manno-octulosonate cytidylyltransferase [Gammaproteobacteria bacterium]